MEHKEAGNSLFSSGKYEDAVVEYSQGLLASPDKEVTLTLLCNRAACHLKLDHFEECVLDCNMVLEKDPVNAKALFRRAQGHMGVMKVEKAYSDLKMLLDVDKTNKAAIDLIHKVRSMAQDMNSTSNQTMALIDSIPSMADELQRGK